MKTSNPGLGWYHRRWSRAVERIDKGGIVRAVGKLRRDHPGESPASLTGRVVRASARLSAAVGITAASPALLPGMGMAISLVGIVPEEIFLTRRKCAMLLKIAAIYGFDPAAPERLYEIIALVENSPRMVQALMTAKDDIGRLMTRAAVGLARVPSQGVKLGTKVVSRRAIRRLPAIGLVAGGAINYYAFRSLGRRAQGFYERMSDRQVRQLAATNA